MASLPNVDDLTEQWLPVLRAAFLEAVSKLRDRVPLASVVALLQQGDVDGALRAVGLDPVAFRGLDGAIAQAFERGGTLATEALPALRTTEGLRLKVLFDVRNLRAESWLRGHSSELVREIVEDQRVAVREHLVAGMAAGQNPRATALELVGRVNPQTKQREGGIIGLTATQGQWVRNYELELKSGNPAAMQKALDRGLRDKRFDRTVLKAIKDGKPLSPEKVASMVAAYKTRALKHRAEGLARTEAMAALNQSQVEAMEQGIAKGQVREEFVTKTWRSAADTRVRHSHRKLNGVKIGFREVYVTESGARLRYPGDPDAPPEERVNCRCHQHISVNFLAMAAKDAA